MKHLRIPSLRRIEPPARVRALVPWIVVVCAMLMFAIVPIAINPLATSGIDPLGIFYPPKFWVLMVLSVVLLIAVLGAALLNRRQLEIPVLLPALAFFNISALSAILSPDTALSFVGERYYGLLSLAAGVLLFYATARFLDSWVRVRAFLTAGVAAAVVVSAYGILQNWGLDPISRWGITWWDVGARVISTLGNAVHLAAYLTLMMGATLALYFLSERRWEQRLCLAALALIGACWLYTYTRGAMFGIVVALPIVLWFAHRRMGSVRPLLLPLAVLAVAMLAAELVSQQPTGVFNRFFLTPPPQEAMAQASPPTGLSQDGDPENTTTSRAAQPPELRVKNLANRAGDGALAQAPPNQEAPSNQASPAQQPPQGNSDLNSVRVRLLVWRDTISMILDRPLLGFGPDNFGQPFLRYQKEDLRALLRDINEYYDNAHNEFLQVAATTGLLGLAAYLWVFVAYFRNAYRHSGWPLLALSGGVLAYILQLQTAFTIIATGVPFWAVLGVSVAIMRLQDRENADAPSDRQKE